jgi:hypothetical protein
MIDRETRIAELPEAKKLQIISRAVDVAGLTISGNRERYAVLYAERIPGLALPQADAVITLVLQVLAIVHEDTKP